jgi:hypothetical protein
MIALAIAHDLITRKRVHPASWMGILAIVLTRIVATTIATSEPGRSTVRGIA